MNKLSSHHVDCSSKNMQFIKLLYKTVFIKHMAGKISAGITQVPLYHRGTVMRETTTY